MWKNIRAFLGSNRLSAVLVAVATLALVLGGAALAAEDGTQFTGCLKNGDIFNVALGSEPTDPCKSGETEVSWNSEGRDGENGATWFSGTDVPDNTLGKDGDLFLLLGDVSDVLLAGDVFVKMDGTWVTQGTLRGPRGPQGPQGPEGPQGEPGVSPVAAFNSTDDAPDGTDSDFTISTEITAPDRGILLMSGGIEAFNLTSFDSYFCFLQIDGKTVTGSRMVSRLNGASTANKHEDCTTSAAEVVDSGTYTIDLDVFDVAADTELGDASVWVVWVPEEAE